MRKKLVALLSGFIIGSIFSVQAFAAGDLNIDTTVNGKIDQGENVQIQINLKDISSFYAGSIDFKYDTSVLKIKSIVKGDLITQKDASGKSISIFEVPDKNLGDGIASYGFSCLGKINGFSGSGTFVVINAEILKKAGFHLKSQPFLKAPSDDLNVKLQIVDTSLKELSYSFNPYFYDAGGYTAVTPAPSAASVVAAGPPAAGTASPAATTAPDSSDASKNSSNTGTANPTDKVSGTTTQAPAASDQAAGSAVKISDSSSAKVTSNGAASETDSAAGKISKGIMISTCGTFLLGLSGFVLFKKLRK